MNDNLKYWMLCTVGITAIASTQANAQQAEQTPEQSGSVIAQADVAAAPRAANADEIVVTARARTESVQSVPIAVSVVGGQRLQQLNISNVEALPQVSSGLTVRQTSANIALITLRGLGTSVGSNQSFEQSVGLFIDGSYAGRGPEFNSALFDLARVEVIKGTQAALLAKNTSLGAISLTTRKPGDQFAFNIIASNEFELHSRSIEAGIDLPLADTFKIRVSGIYNHQGGYVYNVSRDRDLPRINNMGARLVAVWTPSPDLDATFVAQGYRFKQIGSPLEVIYDRLGNEARLAARAGLTGFEANLNGRTYSNDPQYGLGDVDRTHGTRGIATVNYHMGDSTLTSITAYSHFVSHKNIDFDFQPASYVQVDDYLQANKQFSQELRISSPTEKPFNAVAGVLYLHEIFDFGADNVRVNVPLLVGQTVAQVGTFQETFHQLDDQISAFGQANYRLTDQLTFTAGIRVSKDKKRVDLSRDTPVVGPVTTILRPAYPLTRLRRRETNVDGSLGLQYKPADWLMAYVSYSKGSKPGGFQNEPTSPALAGFNTETARTSEIGAKLTFGRSILNVALFNTDLDDYQQVAFVNSAFRIVQRDIRSRGVDAEVGIQATDAIRLSGSVTYADVKRKDVDAAPVGAPKFAGNANISWVQPLVDRLSLQTDFGVEFRSRMLNADAEATLGNSLATASAVTADSGGYGKINLRVGLKSEAGWEIAFVGRNLNDKQVLAYAQSAAYVPGAAVGFLDRPRTLALQLIVRR